ncbi:hypothetical protein K1T71_014048 [Dendrolimus kikuchii]|uniref:Uncharacterized protein n=1 Tax=Dendrolimus kikuchii TaxID=765133 RepID=A0ACC1CEU2_9NEOP|nr:hypothetical protein K1T71_014048 [Dendrolimus kikuchii]
MFSPTHPYFQDTSSEYEECEVLRLQNPKKNDSLVSMMSNLKIESTRPTHLGVSPPKFSSTLTLTTDHPLKGLNSPDGNYPDLIPKKLYKIEDDKDLSFSSIEEEKERFYSPMRNTSKNNLYFSENFVTADSQLLNDSLLFTPDVARVEKVERRRIVPMLNDTPQSNEDSAILKHKSNQSTPVTKAINIPKDDDEDYSGVPEWCESPSHLRSIPNFELPIEMSSSIGMHNDLESPDVVSSSTQEDKSAYQALLDPYTGRVALRPTQPKSPNIQRRKIQLPPEEDRCSLDSISACSMESEEDLPGADDLLEPDQIEELKHEKVPSDDEDTKRSKSTNTMSDCSDPIPEYSAAEELSNERSWVAVPRPNGSISNCDMKVIEPYKRVLSHGGYDSRGVALIVFSACHLPDNARPDYTYVMDNLFLYVIWTLERLVTEEYILVYLHGSAGRRRLPSFHWLHECYKLIDRRLRKSLKHLYLVHPTFWLKSFVIITKPFVSSKFFRKLSYVGSLAELMQKVPIEPNAIPEIVKNYDATRR